MVEASEPSAHLNWSLRKRRPKLNLVRVAMSAARLEKIYIQSPIGRYEAQAKRTLSRVIAI
jgi:hypothetical protein